MNHLIRTELLKQRTLRTFVAGIAAVPIIAGLVAIAILDAAGKEGNEPLSADTLTQVTGGPAAVITLVALLLGVLGMAGETRHQTITTTFLATPRRRNVVIAKLAAHALTGALIGGLSIVMSAAIAVPWLRASGVDIHITGDCVRVAAGLVASTALYGALGVAIGAVLRNQTVAVAVVLTWLLAVEGIVSDLLHGAAFVHWLPAAAGRSLVHIGARGDSLPVPVAAGVFALYVAAFAAVGARLTVHRDIT